jgi:hypothetical protein
MHLTLTELARLESMFASGQVRSDPSTLSATDRMMDAMIQVAKLKTTGRLARRVMSQTARQAAPDHEPEDPRAAECGDRGRSEVEATSEGQPDWDTPRTLEELIEIRRALLRNEQPKL